MKAVLQPNEGERIALSAPLCGEIIIKTDPAAAGQAMGMALQTLPAGGVIPIHRYLRHPLFVWVFKGQGRVAVDNRQYTVVPGHSIAVAAGQWYGLRNTGTGLFQVVWVGPQELFSFFRSLSQANQPLDPSALAALAQPHGIEFQSGSEALLAPMIRPQRGPFRQHHRGRFRQAKQTPPQSTASGEAPSTAAMPVQPPPAPQISSTASAVPGSPSPRPNRRFNNRNRRGSRGSSPAAAAKPAEPSSRSPIRRPSSRKPSRYGRTKEVFMGGKWVRVSGDGPIVASGDK